MSDLVDRLRRRLNDAPMASELMMDEAADRIEQLERVLAQAKKTLYESDARIYELCKTFSVPEPTSTKNRISDAIAAIDEALNTTDDRPSVRSI